VKKGLAETMRRIGVTRRASDRAVEAAYAAQREFQDKLLAAGRRALETLESTGEPGLVLAGRGYNIYDRGVNCDIPRKLRHRYGANVIPLDFLVTGREPLDRPHANMFWVSGRKILEAARIAAARPNLHVVYITNFKCGPDSYIKHFAREAAGAPLLILQFDGHGNDAGYMTRCEAYLDSKGILRCYQPSTEPPPLPRRQHPLTGKRIYIPPMAYGSAQRVRLGLSRHRPGGRAHSALRQRTRELGARYTSGDECYPAKVTVGDFMKVLERPGPPTLRAWRCSCPPPRAPAVSASTRPTCATFWTPTDTSPWRFSRPPARTPMRPRLARQAVRAHRLARAAVRRPAAEAAAHVPPL
jgi:hypothetical protein